MVVGNEGIGCKVSSSLVFQIDSGVFLGICENLFEVDLHMKGQ